MKSVALFVSTILFAQVSLGCMPPPPEMWTRISAIRMSQAVNAPEVSQTLTKLGTQFVKSVETLDGGATFLVTGDNDCSLVATVIYESVRNGACPQLKEVVVSDSKCPSAPQPNPGRSEF
ncbi:MAG: hypothetical protein V4692_08205 [Bdellovibrionota bacterium]